MTDFIGDIHGYADKLEELLTKLNYRKINGIYFHATRKALFVGDYIDRGPQIRETLEIVKGMVETGNAIALLGNHEYNALCFHFQESEGGHLRKHSIKNILQHYETLKQFQNRQKEYEEYLDWFKTLPLYNETESFRAVHACWDEKNIQFLRQNLENDRLTDKLINQSVKKGSLLNEAIEVTLKGKEIRLPNELEYKDKDGTFRSDIRIKWWENPAPMTYRSISVEEYDQLPDERIDVTALKSSDYYQEGEKKVFFGHYWLSGQPSVFRDNVCCLDYSVAQQGKLVVYRLDDEISLDNDKLYFV